MMEKMDYGGKVDFPFHPKQIFKRKKSMEENEKRQTPFSNFPFETMEPTHQVCSRNVKLEGNKK